MLVFYDEDYQVFNSAPLRTVHNGKPGGADEKLLFIRNDDPTSYFTSVVVSYVNGTADDYGSFGSTGWSLKFLTGRRQPTEEEWDSIQAGDSIALPDIGTSLAADTYTFFPFWVRVYCPGGTPAHTRIGQEIYVYFNEEKVGA